MPKGQTCIGADGGVPLHWPFFHTAAGQTSGEGLGVFLPLPLHDYGLATLPLLHGLLVHSPHLLINLKPNPRVNTRGQRPPCGVCVNFTVGPSKRLTEGGNTSRLHVSVMVKR